MHKQFIKVLKGIAHDKMLMDVFADVVRTMQLALVAQTVVDPERQKKIQGEYQGLLERYGVGGVGIMVKLFAMVVESLEAKREDFLGHVLEEIGAANKNNGQFFTPAALGRAMAELTGADLGYTPGNPITVADNAGGSGVLLIEQAEALLKRGVPMGDILVLHGDIDARSCDIAYVQFTLLGYPAIVCHQDGLSGEFYREPMYTLGYYRHCFPMRGIDPMRKVKNEEERRDR